MKNTLLLFFLLFVSAFFCISCRSTLPPVEDAQEDAAVSEEPDAEAEEPDDSVDLPPPDSALPVSVFPEIWAYVLAEREAALTRGLPISDIGYFGAEIDWYGKLCDVPDRRKLPAFSGRVHLVVVCNSSPLTHFILKPGSPERRELIADLIAATRNYDGLQIDFENIPRRDGETFHSFLAELRSGLGRGKMLTIALPARTRKISNDIFDYETILPLVDRILVMAYDEHWSTSAPGPIASLAWCRNVARYAMSVIGREKLIMGLPFYGRAWARPNPNHSGAYIYTGIERLMRENNVTGIRRENGIPTFDYDVATPVNVKVYYEDEYSLSTRMEMYRSLNINKIGFWRLGQETPQVWRLLKLEK